jgi:hypothetical protein
VRGPPSRRGVARASRLSHVLAERFARSAAWGRQLREGFSDLRFTDANRVPFPFARLMRERFDLCSVVTESKGPRLLDLDGNWSLDVSGAYGVNVAGFDAYKEWMRRGLERVENVGPVSVEVGALQVCVGAALIGVGQALNFGVFFRLGTLGVFYGNRFGYDLPHCGGLPFSLCKHPQYFGAVLSIWGFFVIARFPHDDWMLLPVLETLYYALGAHFES